jgi:hypothetical protein
MTQHLTDAEIMSLTDEEAETMLDLLAPKAAPTYEQLRLMKKEQKRRLKFRD